MSGRYELHSVDPDTGKTGLFALTDSANVAEKWALDGGTVIDTSVTNTLGRISA